MSNEKMTLMGFGGIGNHRSCSIKKVENGFVLEVMIERKMKGERSSIGATFTDKEKYVAHNLEEVLDMINTYFKCEQDDVKRG